MRDNTHLEQVERWAELVKKNPVSWRKEHTAFINAQITRSWKFYERLSKTPNGKSKMGQLLRLREIKR